MRERTMADDLPADEGRALRAEAPENLRNVRVALIETLEPGNIGAAARAMKGMGLSDLRLVRPREDWIESAEARKFAMNSKDVLFAARSVETLEDAIGDAHFVVGTTHRRRVRRIAQPVNVRDAVAQIARVSQTQSVALVFGREDFGMSNEDLARCNLIASVPMATKNPSLNLAQAVQIFAYELFTASLETVEPIRYELAARRDVDATVYRIEQMLRAVDFRPMNENWDAVQLAVLRVLGRAPLEKRDLEVIMKICHDVEGFVERNVSAS